MIETEEEDEDGWLLLPVGDPLFVKVLRYELESVNFASEFTAERAIKVFASTVTNLDGVKLAVVVDVPEYRADLAIVKLVN